MNVKQAQIFEIDNQVKRLIGEVSQMRQNKSPKTEWHFKFVSAMVPANKIK